MIRKAAAMLLLCATLAGCGVRPASDPPGARAFPVASDDRWIGNAVCYGPHRDGQRPGGADPTDAQLLEDLRLMLPRWKLMRVYGAAGVTERLLPLIRAEELPMKVVLGAWIARESEPGGADANRLEVDTAIRLANDYPDIVTAVSVGNETQVSWSAHRSDLQALIGHIRAVRAGVSVPVTTADDFNFWNKDESLPVAAEIDFLMMHAHPMWNGLQLDGALPWLVEQIAEVRSLHPDLPLVVGETGWATTVHDQGEQAKLIKGKPGEAEQAAYFRDVREWAAASGTTVFFFEAFDENWKGGPHPDEVEKHWGLFRADRTPKAAVR